MNLEKTERLLSLLKQYGVSHYKTQDIELKMGEIIGPTPLVPFSYSQADAFSETEPEKSSKTPRHAAAAPPVSIEIPHHVNEVANLLKLSDEELVDRLFPDPTQPSEAKE